jgi:hypothetical protein
MDVLKRLIRDERFWLAVVDVIQILIFHFSPTFPPELWEKIHILILVLISVITANDMVSLFVGVHWSQKE